MSFLSSLNIQTELNRCQILKLYTSLFRAQDGDSQSSEQVYSEDNMDNCSIFTQLGQLFLCILLIYFYSFSSFKILLLSMEESFMDKDWREAFVPCYSLCPTKRLAFCPIFVRPTDAIKTRDTHIAVKSERTIPRPSISPNPLMSDIPKT